MAKPPAYQMYAADFDTDTAEWTNAEVGAYQRLLNSEWINGSLPADPARLARIAREPLEEFLKLWSTIGGKFHENGNGRLYNRRLEEVRAQQAAWREKSSKGGKASAEKRKNNQQASKDSTKEQPSDKPTGAPKGDTSDSSFQPSTPSTKNKDGPEQKKSAQDSPPSKIDFDWKTKEFLNITEEDIQGWRETYPAVDITQEIKKAREWLISNPEKRKKKYRRFLTTWFNRTQEKGGTKGYQPQKPHIKTENIPSEKEWDEEQAKRKEANEQWRALDAYDREPYIEKAKKDPRNKLMKDETVAFLIFCEELNARREADRNLPEI